MLEFSKSAEAIVATLEQKKLKDKTEAYLVEMVTQKLADLFIARYGEQILARIDPDTLLTTITNHVTTTLSEESKRVLRDHQDATALRGEGGGDKEKASERAR